MCSERGAFRLQTVKQVLHELGSPHQKQAGQLRGLPLVQLFQLRIRLRDRLRQVLVGERLRHAPQVRVRDLLVVALLFQKARPMHETPRALAGGHSGVAIYDDAVDGKGGCNCIEMAVPRRLEQDLSKRCNAAMSNRSFVMQAIACMLN